MNATPEHAAVLRARLQQARNDGKNEFTLPPGEHLIHGDWLPDRFCHVSKRVIETNR